MLGGNAKAKHFKYTDRFENIKFDIPQLGDMFDELANSLCKPYLKTPSDEEKAEYEAIIKSASKEVAGMLETTVPGRYLAAAKNSADPQWLVKTLRKYADLIPLPSQEAKTGYDYHYNCIIHCPLRDEGHTLARPHQTYITSSRVAGLAGQLSSLPSSMGTQKQGKQ